MKVASVSVAFIVAVCTLHAVTACNTIPTSIPEGNCGSYWYPLPPHTQPPRRVYLTTVTAEQYGIAGVFAVGGMVDTNSGLQRTDEVWFLPGGGEAGDIVGGVIEWEEVESTGLPGISGHCLVAPDPDTLLVITGRTDAAVTDAVYKSVDGGLTWSHTNGGDTGGFLTARRFASCACTGTKCFVMGGLLSDGVTAANDVLVSTDFGATWVPDSYTVPWSGRSQASAGALAGKIVIVGGKDADGIVQPGAFLFDPNGGWTELSGLPVGLTNRYGGSVVQAGSRLFFAFGVQDGVPQSALYEMIPNFKGGPVASCSDPDFGRRNGALAALPLASGYQLLAIGGYNDEGSPIAFNMAAWENLPCHLFGLLCDCSSDTSCAYDFISEEYLCNCDEPLCGHEPGGPTDEPCDSTPTGRNLGVCSGVAGGGGPGSGSSSSSNAGVNDDGNNDDGDSNDDGGKKTSSGLDPVIVVVIVVVASSAILGGALFGWWMMKGKGSTTQASADKRRDSNVSGGARSAGATSTAIGLPGSALAVSTSLSQPQPLTPTFTQFSGTAHSTPLGMRPASQGSRAKSLLPSIQGESWTIPPHLVTIERRIGGGAYGQVWFGTYSGSPVALKQLYSGMDDPNSIDELKAEATLLSRLHHPNVVHFFGICIRDDDVYLVTEYCPASVLSYLMDANADHSLSNIVALAIQIARGMRYLHSKGVIHRDLKPDNLLLTAAGQVRVCDFGLARVQASKSMTVNKGTPAYMAPETMTLVANAGGKRYTNAVDVYSFGVLLWTMSTRRQPFGNVDNPFAIPQLVLQNNRPPIPGNMPPRLANLITACWAGNPNSRPSFAEVETVLQDADVLTPTAPAQVPVYHNEHPEAPPRPNPSQLSTPHFMHPPGPKGTPPANGNSGFSAGGATPVVSQVAPPPPPASAQVPTTVPVPAPPPPVAPPVKQMPPAALHVDMGVASGVPDSVRRSSTTYAPMPSPVQQHAGMFTENGGDDTLVGATSTLYSDIDSAQAHHDPAAAHVVPMPTQYSALGTTDTMEAAAAAAAAQNAGAQGTTPGAPPSGVAVSIQNGDSAAPADGSTAAPQQGDTPAGASPGGSQ